ncbi:MAG TPA: hypothetical protein VHZ31_03625 [Solirubrobacteraceae bacterium]|nr:hypothetical protein [Solirubrobacteraceae bacterium]
MPDPPDAFEQLFDRETLLGGLPARRAGTLLFLIESRTARLTAQSRQAMARFATREAGQRRELAFLEAFALGREPPLRPTIQDLERHAPRWAPLVARNPRVQAALARRFGEKHALARGRVPRIAAALGLDDERVAAAFEQLYERPLDSIYVERPALAQRVAWRRAAVGARLEGLSPFWTAYALTLTETVGSTIVALPIAVAAIGPLPAVAVLVALGLVNVLTVAFMADALTRSATIRYGSAYIGRVVTELLGRQGALVLTAGLVGICLMGMQADYIGVSSTLTDVTSIPQLGWVALLFAVELAYLRRGSIDATVASALVVGAVNIALILALCALGFAHVRVANLTHVSLPFTGGHGFDRSALALCFGVTFTAYFGHLSVSNCARVVLGRDASGRTLVRGVVAAQLTAIVLYVLFVVAVAGAVAPARLAHETGTALAPLADRAGPAVLALGGILVVLGMGMASIHSALALFYLVRERLPSRAPLTLVLPRRAARVVLEGRGATRIAMTYLGVERGAARLRLDVRVAGVPERSFEGVATRSQPWEPLHEPALRDLGARGLGLRVAVLSATDHEACLEVQTSLRLRYEGAWDSSGVSLAGILELPDDEGAVLAHVLRRTDASAAEIAALCEISPAAACAMLEALAARGLISESLRGGERRYVARAGRRRGGRLPAEMWEALSDSQAGAQEEPSAAHPARPLHAATGAGSATSPDRAARGEPATSSAGTEPARPATASGGAAPAGPAASPRRAALAARARHALSSDRGRFLAGVSPVVAVFAFAAWQATVNAISLAGVLSFLGVIIVALLAGVFPVLLLVAARSRGELLAWDYRLPAGRWVLGGVYAIAVGGVALHGLVLWTDPLQRACAIAIAVLALALTARAARGGAFAPLATIELRHDAIDATATLAIVAAGRAVPADVVLAYDDGRERRARSSRIDVARFEALRRVVVTPDWSAVQPVPAELRLWAHRVSAENDSEPLDVGLESARADSASAGARHDGDALVMALDASSPSVTITLSGKPTAA